LLSRRLIISMQEMFSKCLAGFQFHKENSE
jgi:hypothetical protein